MSRSNPSRDVELSEAQQRRRDATERKKAAARRAWEGQEMSNEAIAREVGVCTKTLNRWIEEWRKG